MTCMIDRWHDAYHENNPDYVNCPYCQDDLLLAEPEEPPELLFNGEPVDVIPIDDTDDVFEARYPHTDRAFIITADEIVVAADWE